MNRLRREDGVALPIAIIVLMVMIILTGVAVSSAVNGSTASNRDANDKRALEAAQAGVRVALYRINMLGPGDPNCVGTTATAPASNGLCTDGPESDGNGGTFQYWTTPALTSTGTCVGLALVSQTSLSQRCVTATGTVNGITARAQARVVSYTSQPLFPEPGITVLKSGSLSNNDTVNGTLYTGGTVTIANNVTITNTVLGPQATTPGSAPNGASYGTITQRTQAQGAIVLPEPDFGTSATTNSDGRLSGSPPQDAQSGVTFNTSTRDLTIASNGSLTLGGGIYNFCSITAGNNATIAIAPGALVSIYVDSSARSGSGCSTSSSGTITTGNSFSFTNYSQDPTALKVFIYGPASGTGTATIDNQADFFGSLYAPTSSVNWGNGNNGSKGWRFNGGIAASTVTMGNNYNFGWDSRDANLAITPKNLFYQTAWMQCPAHSSSSTDPTAGC